MAAEDPHLPASPVEHRAVSLAAGGARGRGVGAGRRRFREVQRPLLVEPRGAGVQAAERDRLEEALAPAHQHVAVGERHGGGIAAIHEHVGVARPAVARVPPAPRVEGVGVFRGGVISDLAARHEQVPVGQRAVARAEHAAEVEEHGIDAERRVGVGLHQQEPLIVSELPIEVQDPGAVGVAAQQDGVGPPAAGPAPVGRVHDCPAAGQLVGVDGLGGRKRRSGGPGKEGEESTELGDRGPASHTVASRSGRSRSGSTSSRVARPSACNAGR